MTPHDQLHHGPNRTAQGDCWRTCVACLLDLRPEEVPHFGEIATQTGEWFFEITKRWLRDRGLTMMFDCYPPEGFSIATGGSPREHINGHACIVDGTGIDKQADPPIVHDPHPSRSGLTTMETYFWITPLYEAQNWL